jgi:hypothetical protein
MLPGPDSLSILRARCLCSDRRFVGGAASMMGIFSAQVPNGDGFLAIFLPILLPLQEFGIDRPWAVQTLADISETHFATDCSAWEDWSGRFCSRRVTPSAVQLRGGQQIPGQTSLRTS